MAKLIFVAAIYFLALAPAASIAADTAPQASGGQVKVVSEYTLTADDMAGLKEKFGVSILAGFYNTYQYDGFQYGVNFLKCNPRDIEDLIAVAIQLEPRSVLLRADGGVFEVITFEPDLARKIIRALPGVEPIEQAKLIPIQFSKDWLLAGEYYASAKDIEQLKSSLGKGIVKVLNQVFIPGSSKRVGVNYILCDNADHAQFVYASIAGKSGMPGSALRFGKLVVEIASDDEAIVGQIRSLFGG